ncbi:MAG: hypothetical protein ACH37H_17590, partial [Ilumatobacteraceae bacterium]
FIKQQGAGGMKSAGGWPQFRGVNQNAISPDTGLLKEWPSGGPVHIVGWSDGGIIGLLLALRRPALLGRLVAIGANYHWNVLPDLTGTAAADDAGGDATPEAESGDGGIVALMAAAYADCPRPSSRSCRELHTDCRWSTHRRSSVSSSASWGPTSRR